MSSIRILVITICLLMVFAQTASSMTWRAAIPLYAALRAQK